MDDPSQYQREVSAKQNYSFWFYRSRSAGDFTYRSVEDGYVIKERAKAMTSVFEEMGVISFLYLMQGVLTRGGVGLSDPIKDGKLAFKNNKMSNHTDYRMMQDQSLIRAHEIESTTAKNAVIQIQKEIIDYQELVIESEESKVYFAKSQQEAQYRRNFRNCFVTLNSKEHVDIFLHFQPFENPNSICSNVLNSNTLLSSSKNGKFLNSCLAPASTFCFSWSEQMIGAVS